MTCTCFALECAWSSSVKTVVRKMKVILIWMLGLENRCVHVQNNSENNFMCEKNHDIHPSYAHFTFTTKPNANVFA